MKRSLILIGANVVFYSSLAVVGWLAGVGFASLEEMITDD